MGDKTDTTACTNTYKEMPDGGIAKIADEIIGIAAKEKVV
jgi:hypothetical protein